MEECVMRLGSRLIFEVVAVGILFSIPNVSIAADHTEAPSIMNESGSFVDITDVYAFRSPSDANNLVVAMGMFSEVAAQTPPLFDSLARYEFQIDTDADYRPDTTIRVVFSDTGNGNKVTQYLVHRELEI